MSLARTTLTPTRADTFGRTFHPDNRTTRIGYLGCQQINTSMKSMDFETRSAIAKECILRICEAAGLRPVDDVRTPPLPQIAKMLSGRPNLTFTGSDVSLEITSSLLRLTSIDGGVEVAAHEMANISFASGGDSETVDFVAYVAKDKKHGRACFVLECKGGLGKEIITTIGQAFEIRFKEIFRRSSRQRNESTLQSINESDSDKDYYNDLPGKVPPDLTSSTVEQSQINGCSRHTTHKPQAVPRSTVKKKCASTGSFAEDLIDLTDPSRDSEDRPGQEEVESINNSDEDHNIKDPFDMQPFNSTLKQMFRRNRINVSEEEEDNNNTHLGCLEDQEWYHGAITRMESEQLVVADGDFLVRESQVSPKQYVLTGKERGIVRHLLLVDDDGVTVKTKDRKFKNIVHLVQFYQGNNLPLVLGEDPIYLRRPVKVPSKV